jgi:sodium/bile acid cotransporter 7
MLSNDFDSTVFCRTFYVGKSVATIGETFLMILFQFLLLLSSMILGWFLLKLLFRDEPELRVMGVFGCVNKTVALGIPLIDAIYGSDPNAGLYTLPLLIWFPMQLVVGSTCIPRLVAFVTTERERLDKLAAVNDEAMSSTENSSNPEQTCMNPASHDHAA